MTSLDSPSTVPTESSRSAGTETDEEPLVTLDEIRGASARLRGVVLRTPLVPFGRPRDGDPLGHSRAWLKAEMLQPIGAFKLRGAYNALASLPPERRAAGVVTHSSGNHAQGVARAALLFGVRAVIVMPEDAPRTKIAGVRADGAEIVFVSTTNEERVARARAIADAEGLELIPSYDDRRIIAGQGTIGIEIVEQVAELGGADEPLTVLVPIGGGGLAAGISTAVKALRSDAHVYGVEPALAADARDSLTHGRIVAWPAEQVGRTMADGMRTAAVGVLPFRHLRRDVDGVVVVQEEEIARAMVRGARGARLVLEPSGATSLAALLFREQELPSEGRIVAVLSGGNVDADRYRELIALGEAAGG